MNSFSITIVLMLYSGMRSDHNAYVGENSVQKKLFRFYLLQNAENFLKSKFEITFVENYQFVQNIFKQVCNFPENLTYCFNRA